MSKFLVMDNQGIADWDIWIGRIVIEGIVLTSYQQQQLRASLEAELGRIFEGRGIPGNVRNIRGKVTGEPIRLESGPVQPEERNAPVQLEGRKVAVQMGKQVAASVYNSLSDQ
jgi:hypothetical protein